jgi:PAS domain S-box-containing protein
MRFFRNMSIPRKLTLVILAASAAALFMGCAAFVVYEASFYRKSALEELTTEARIIGINCRAALLFKDSKAAEETLAALKAEPHVEIAYIYSADENVFAKYLREGWKESYMTVSAARKHAGRTNNCRVCHAADEPTQPGWKKVGFPVHASDGHMFGDMELSVFEPIMHNNERIGTVYVRVDLRGLHDRIRSYVGIELLVMAVSCIGALAISYKLQKLVSRPILELANTARRISEQKDYTVRGTEFYQDEVGQLIRAFNEMLTQIQGRDKALEDSERHFRSLIENANDIIMIIDRGSRVRYVSPSVKRFLGFAPDELIGKIALDYIHADDMKTVLEQLLQIAEDSEGTASAEYRFRCKDGSWIYLESKARNLLSGPNLAGIIVNSRDITERKRAEEQLRLQSAALEAAANTIVITDSHGVVLWVNPSFTTLTGYSREEVIGRTLRTLKSDKHDSNFYRELWETVNAGHVWHGEVINRRKDGSLYNEEMTITPVYDGNGTISRFVAIKQDITERKQAQTEMENMHRQLLDVSRYAGMAEVATNVLHNVGNVLNSVNVSAALVSEKVQKSKVPNLAKAAALMREHENDLAVFLAQDPKGTQLVSYLGALAQHLGCEQVEILKELESLDTNIEHIKEIVTMQQNYASASGIVDTLPVVDLVEDALRMNAGALARHDVQVVREYIATPSVPVDKHKVLQILINLVRNAKYALDDGEQRDKRLRVRVATDGDDFVKISVIDNGVGIAPEHLTRIFEHGFTTRKDGHGFGLHSGALAAKEMGGSLSMHSDGPGRGATFTLSLPRHQEHENL